MRKLGIIFVLCLFSAMAFAQHQGYLNLIQDSRIEGLMDKQQQMYAIDSSSNGYRIHVFMEIGNEALSHAQEVKERFEEAFPEIPAYLTYSEPYFRLRVGDFRNRVEAQKCLVRIKPEFKEAFVIPDNIYQPKLNLPEPTIMEVPLEEMESAPQKIER